MRRYSMMDELLRKLRIEADAGSATAGEAARTIDVLLMDRRERENEMSRLASRNVALVIENDALKSVLDYRARG
jgi:hypothetical protein